MGLSSEQIGAYVPGPAVEREPLAEGPLSGLSFAVKDLFDIAGTVTGYGHPDWARTHPPATATAPVVQTLLQAGARLAGKTKTVELAYGLTGENVWYGTPLNPSAPDRFPGGSSCGSAAAVAGGLVDFALGSDTGGSVRIPASYCGLFGFRPTHGAISLAGARPLAPSLDTAGWFARDAATFGRVGAVLLPEVAGSLAGPLLRVDEAWVNAQPAVAEALRPALARIEAALGRALSLNLVPEGLPELYEHFRCVQAEEAWVSLGGWVQQHHPRFGPGVSERFLAAKALEPARAQAGRGFRRRFAARVVPLLAGGAVLVQPTSPCPAPPLNASPLLQSMVREATIAVTAIAGFAGAPEVTLPLAEAEGAPVGLSLVAAPGRDRALLDLACRIAALFD